MEVEAYEGMLRAAMGAAAFQAEDIVVVVFHAERGLRPGDDAPLLDGRHSVLPREGEHLYKGKHPARRRFPDPVYQHLHIRVRLTQGTFLEEGADLAVNFRERIAVQW